MKSHAKSTAYIKEVKHGFQRAQTTIESRTSLEENYDSTAQKRLP